MDNMCAKINLIVAVSENMGIGSKGKLPWHLPKELKYFSRMTRRVLNPSKCNAVIMGRRTWESIPAANRPLAKRRNLVLSSQTLSLPKGVALHRSLESALLNVGDDVETAWIIGGASLYKEALEKELCDKLYVTRVLRSYDCDVFLPDIGPGYRLTSDPDVTDDIQSEDLEDEPFYMFQVYEKVKN